MTERTASCSSHELQPTDVSLISPTKSSSKVIKRKGSSLGLVSDLDLAVTEGVKDILNHNGHSSSDTTSGCDVPQEGSQNQNDCFDVCSSKSKLLSNSNEDTGQLLIESEFAKIQKLGLVCNGEMGVEGVGDRNSDDTNSVPLNPSTRHVVENSANMFPPRHKLLQYQSQYANTSDNSNTKTNLVTQDVDNEDLCVHCSSHYSQSMCKSKNLEKMNGLALAESLTALSLADNISLDSQLTINSADYKMQECEIECTSSVCDTEAEPKVSSCECHNEEADNHVPSAETKTPESSACQHELKSELDTLVIRLEDTNFNYSDSTSEPFAIVPKEVNSRHFGSGDTTTKPDSTVTYEVYESEKQMPDIIRLITKDLSEPYSIYTYRYFIHNWPKLCFLALADDKCVGAIVCKLDLHKKMVRRGYIAMLAVDSEYRRRKIGSTLVTKAIEAMIQDDCDEVVLETEITNQGALRLYENLGFVRDKRLFRYYLNGVDALRLKLWLR